ncbi:sarcocystatin-A-like [Lucilia cuprina]|uniref:sarcocystatin-A-like n=1 Tax=Lucilia cuprina TaxID=7375 RepID=UPI001F064EC0|nr:sarcocystatin-A-like [Lucilia cuprina]
MKIVLILCLTAVVLVSARPGCPGCVTHLAGNKLKEAEGTLNFSLSKLAAKDGPYYRLLKVNAASTQVVAGIKHVIIADLIDNSQQTKTCRVTIWSQPWLPNGTEVNFECPGEEKITRRHGS